MGNRTLPITLPALLLFSASLLCGNPDDPPYIGVEDDAVGTGTVFIWAISSGEEELAMSKLSTIAQAAVDDYCENGEVLAYFDQVGIQDWGKVEIHDIARLPTYSHGSTFAYQVILGRRRITGIGIVLEIVYENSEWRVDSWRGWIPLDERYPDGFEGLLYSGNPPNPFPPEE